jgi:A/G-specific adenine glycosylase
MSAKPPGQPATKNFVLGLRTKLLAWYDLNRRDLPWRRTKDPYSIWVSEIMLQQTRVAAVIDKYQLFLKNFSTVSDLAAATEAEVLTLWSGLGYYRRARMLHKGAATVVENWQGVMPPARASLRELPGIGAYTSAAIASIAYGEPVAVVDGNVERVVQRLAGWGASTTEGQADLARATEDLASTLLDPEHAGNFNQAMMELGATVCLPRNPQCLVCPVREFCKTQGEHPTPVRAKMRNEDAAYALVLRQLPYGSEGTNGLPQVLPQVLLVQRSAKETVMPGMWELPALRDTEISDDQVRLTVRHAIMQVNYRVRIRLVLEEELDCFIHAPEDAKSFNQHQWFRLSELDTLPLTGLARKVLLRSKLAELRLPELAASAQ